MYECKNKEGLNNSHQNINDKKVNKRNCENFPTRNLLKRLRENLDRLKPPQSFEKNACKIHRVVY